jgi:hypothetical protein
MIPVIFQYDATTQNEHLLPASEMCAGYDPGVNVAWTPQQYDRHRLPYPAMHIDQDPNAADPLADWLDVEAGAATNAEIVNWLHRARNLYFAKTRPGQRWPGIYCSENNVASAVGLLINAGLQNVPFWVANYSISEAEAIRRVSTAIGPYPAAGYQYTDQEFGGLADGSIMALPHIIQTNLGDVDMPFGQLTSQAFVPFQAGSYSRVMLYQDFISAANPTNVRIALHSVSAGYYDIQHVQLNTAVPFTVGFGKADTDGVSLALESGADGPVGYTVS